VPQLPQIIADLVVAIDQSNSMNLNDFDLYVKPFVRDWLKQMSIGEKLAQIGYVSFSDQILNNGWLFTDVTNQSVNYQMFIINNISCRH
jgi:hypothetical protein